MADFKIKSTAGTGNLTLLQSQDQSGSDYAIKIGDSGASTLTNATLTAPTITDLSNVSGTPSAITLTNATFPAGYVHQDKIYRSGRETNSVTTTHVNYYEVSINLKSATSHIHAVVESTWAAGGNDDGGGVEIRRKTSAGVANSDAEISAYHAYDGAGPHDILYTVGAGASWTRFTVHGADTFSGVTRSVGDTMYYGVFARKYNSSSSCSVPGAGSGGNSEFIMRLTEVQQ